MTALTWLSSPAPLPPLPPFTSLIATDGSMMPTAPNLTVTHRLTLGALSTSFTLLASLPLPGHSLSIVHAEVCICPDYCSPVHPLPPYLSC